MSELYETLGAELGPAALRELVLTWVPGVVAAAISVVVFWLLWTAVRRVLQRIFVEVKLDRTAAAFVMSVLRFGFSLVGALTALNQLGVDTTSVLASLGVAGLTLGFAAQDTLSNVISGLFIFWDRPFVLGDLVEADGEYGRVEAITLRSTRLVTPDGRMFAIPNKVIANAKVASYTNFPHLRLDVELTVGVDSNIGKVRDVMLETVRGRPGFSSTPAPQLVVAELGDYNITVQLRAWIDDERNHIQERYAMRERMLEAARGAGIDLPFETIQLQPVELRPTPVAFANAAPATGDA